MERLEFFRKNKYFLAKINVKIAYGNAHGKNNVRREKANSTSAYLRGHSRITEVEISRELSKLPTQNYREFDNSLLISTPLTRE